MSEASLQRSGGGGSASGGGGRIRQVLGPDGLLAAYVPGYEIRPQQMAMAERVLQAMEQGSYLLAEAGTGTGKTMAYLLPALLSGKRVVVSTATKTLQEQIFFKDIPLLEKVLGRKIPAAYMKGRSNYLCKLRYEQFAEDPRFVDPAEAKEWPTLRAWAASTQTGDRAELSLPEVFVAWREMSSTGETCLGQKCPQWESCHVTEMRRKAQEAQIVVVNHHLFFADLALRARGEDIEVIPRYDAVVFDEAHALEEVATDYFGVQVSNYRLEELVRDSRQIAEKAVSFEPMLRPLIDAVEGRAAGFVSALETATGLWRGRESRDAVLRLEEGSLAGCAQEQAELIHALQELGRACGDNEQVPELETIGRRSLALRDEIAFACEVQRGSPFVHFVEKRGRGLFLRAAPIEVDGELRKHLWSKLPVAVFASATLAVGGRFDYVRRRLGLGMPGVQEAIGGDGASEKMETSGREGARRRALLELQVGSPFDYRRQAALYLPTHLPEPQAPEFTDEVALELERLFAITGGRAFALFTSVRNMRRAWELLEPRLPYRVLLQGELPKAQLLQRFQEKPSVLFATASFWEGVDVQGEALSLVAIDKLPFASPGDPVVAARVEALRSRGADAFGGYQVPQAAIALRQGFGRLIRSRSDRGIVAVLDRRIVTKGYGRTFLRSLPDCPRFDRLPYVSRWWVQGGGSM